MARSRGPWAFLNRFPLRGETPWGWGATQNTNTSKMKKNTLILFGWVSIITTITIYVLVILTIIKLFM